ncbi:sigma-70 family RNA polymerase sigma factor, partial [Patescibacteria group bacterium]|nr:sigma-70 family RNA polymerase sigma factor [Patescibacteria group bacterium]MBU1915862.1 sigma-70 family RNA polymerase sigma factor [Patescibacteria group bacterium]
MIAAEKYDPDLGYAFLTYAAWWVKNSLAHYCADFSRTIRVPINAQEKYRKLYRADQLNTAIDLEADIVRAMQFTMLPIDPLQVERGAVADVADPKFGTRAETLLTDMIHHREKMARVQIALEQLPEIWREVLKIRFLEEQTLEDAGKILHERGITPRRLTRERIRQIEFKAKRKLQQILLETKE